MQQTPNLPEGARELPQSSGLVTKEIRTIRAGDVVQEIGYTQRMTVREIVLDGYVCDWFEGDEYKSGKFAPGSLRLAPPQVEPRSDSSPSYMQIEAIAIICHEANRAYCEVVMNDRTQLPWDDAPLWQRDSARLGVQKILSGEVTRPEQSHESWLAEKRAEGWQYGPVKDPDAKLHPCFVPYEALPVLQRYKDHLFLAIVRALGTQIG
jgi:uncharacterized protein YodC (DUF2158 family)